MKTAQILSIVLSTLALPQPAGSEPPTRFAADRPMDCLHIRLELNVDVPAKRVEGLATLRLTALRSVTSITFDAHDLDVRAITVTGDDNTPAPADFDNDGDQIEVFLDQPLAAGDRISIAVQYTVDDPADGLHFFGPSKNEPDVPYVVWSQGEATTNSYWFPCFDHPNERQTTELIVTTDRKYKVSSNGRLVSNTRDADTGTVTYHWLQDKPHPAYLVSMIVGEFHVERDTWRGKPVTYWAHPRYKDRIARSFHNTKRMLNFFSDQIGIEYPWDRYAQICCEGFGGGMENTSATTLGNRALHDERSFLDSNSDGLIAHELAHQWWGDLLTCRDWAHLWLNEGFASYFEALWAEHDLGDDEFRYNLYRKARGARRGGKDRPIVDRAYPSPGSMFDARAYPKGAWVLHMIRKRLGDKLFWAAINRYGTQNALQPVETSDLRKAIEDQTGHSFERFFYDWTARPGHPEVTVAFQWHDAEKLAEVNITQTQEADAFEFPLAIEFGFSGDIKAIKIERLVDQKELRFYQPLPEHPHLVRTDPDYSVLMDLSEEKSDTLWHHQLLQDPDPIGRIRAAKHFGQSTATADRRLLASALASESFWGVQREIAKALAETGGDIARDALLAGLKFENRKARRACVESLADFSGDDAVIAAVRPLAVEGAPSYNVEAAALETYPQLDADDALDVLRQALSRDSRNEIIRRASLTGLGDLDDPQAVALLIEWSSPDKPRLSRPAAIVALADVTENAELDDPTTESIVKTLAGYLDDTGVRVRGAAVRALGSLSPPALAKTVLDDLDDLADHDASERIRRAAKRTAKAIRKDKPASDRLAELRTQLEEAQDRNDELSDRLAKLEALVSDRSQATASASHPSADTNSENSNTQ